MSNRPTRNKCVGIGFVNEEVKYIRFYSDESIARQFAEFGKLGSLGNDEWILWVDARYDFGDTVAYIRDYVPPHIPSAFLDALGSD